MKNFIAEGKVLAVVAPAGGITAGKAVLVGDLVGVAITSAAEGETCTVSLYGVYELTKGVGAINQGKKCYFVTSDETIIGTASSNKFTGYAFEDAAAADATVKVILAQ
jgi:predicted RecA/RadA family phage recombinase